MIFACTKHCHEYDHPEIRISYDEHLGLQHEAEEFLAGLEREVSKGVVFKAGESIQIGWMMCDFFPLGDGTLELREPDFKSFPIQVVDSMTLTLKHLIRQRESLASIGLCWSQSDIHNSIYDSALVCDRLFSSEDFMMVRNTPKGNDSGWFIGCLQTHDHNNAKNLRRESLYEIGRKFPPAIDLIMLPPGTTLAYSKQDGYTVYREGGTLLPVREGSYLDVKWKRGGSG